MYRPKGNPPGTTEPIPPPTPEEDEDDDDEADRLVWAVMPIVDVDVTFPII